MSNKVKKIIGLALAFNIISSVVPTALSIGSMAVYASDKNEGIKDIDANKTLRKSSYSGSSTSYKDSISTYYVKLSESTKYVKIDAKAEDGYTVEVHEGSSSSDVEGDEISISKGKTKTFKVVSYKDGTKKGEVTVKVKRADSDDDDDDDDDDIELKDLELEYNHDDIDFDFDEDKRNYDIKLKNEVDYVKVTAEPDDEDDIVRVNDVRVRESDDWQSEKIELKEGKNEIKVTVKDDDDNSRTYTLNITRAAKDGSTNTSSTNTTTNNNQTAVTKNTGWKYTNGKWQYYDANGNLYKNSWVTDAKGKNYYLGADGNMVTGWLTLGGNQYYFDLASGERKTGWICLGKTWYQFDSRGVLVK